jgi:RNA polymerase sigma-70 factor (ECF subfamily)
MDGAYENCITENSSEVSPGADVLWRAKAGFRGRRWGGQQFCVSSFSTVASPTTKATKKMRARARNFRLAFRSVFWHSATVRGPGETTSPEGTGQFATTHWSVVLAARDGDPSAAFAALERLCHSYWRPIYAFIRRDGHGPLDAQDLTQEFLSRLVHKDWLNHLHDQRGKFRSFLLTFLKHFLSGERARASTQKRGGGRSFVSLDAFELEERAKIEPADEMTADQIYERRWAWTIMAQAADRLREEYTAWGKAALFEQIKDLQPGERGERSYAEIGTSLGISEQAIKNAVHDLRRRHREILRAGIAQTVSDTNEVDEEIRHLLRLFGG